MQSIKYILITLSLALILISCGDDVPTDYKEDIFVEAYLLVGEPIQNIVVAKTQPVTSTYNYENSLMRDAQVVIKTKDKVLPLKIASSGEQGFYYEDSNYLVEENTEYTLEITTADGKVISGITTTPENIAWVERIPNPLQYPIDSLNPPTSDPISWTESKGIDYYIIAVNCLDTLEYGTYLDDVPDAELNRRIERPWTNEEDFYDIANFGFIPNTETKIVWSIFKWFGKSETVVYAPDNNFRDWFIQNQWLNNSYDENLSSVDGAIGVFGSAAVIRDTSFVLKNQP